MTVTADAPRVGIARASRDKRALGKVHRNSTDHVPTAKRNRMRLYTACGLRLDNAFPFEVTAETPTCRKCWP